MNRKARSNEEWTLDQARNHYFNEYGFDESGYGCDTVTLKAGIFLVCFPNVKERQEALPYHDIHHVVTGYDAVKSNVVVGSREWQGEAELAAWEFGIGIRHLLNWEVFLIDGFAFFIGLFTCIKKTFSAFKRGTVCRSLYARQLSQELLNRQLIDLRHELGLNNEVPKSNLKNVSRFILSSILVIVTVTVTIFIFVFPLMLLQTVTFWVTNAMTRK